MVFVVFLVPQAVFATAACVQADIMRCATSRNAALANDCASVLLVVLQYVGGPRLCFEFHQTRCAPMHAGIAAQISILLGADAAHITATPGFVLCRRYAMMQLLQLRHDELLQCVVRKFQRRYFRVALGLFSVAVIVVIICGARGCKYVPTDVLFTLRRRIQIAATP